MVPIGDTRVETEAGAPLGLSDRAAKVVRRER